MITTITILENNLEVEWNYDITAHGNNGCAPSLSYPGDPPEPCEFDIEILGVEFPKQAADITLELPLWLKQIIASHLYERDDINEIVQQADQDCGDYDPYDERI